MDNIGKTNRIVKLEQELSNTKQEMANDRQNFNEFKDQAYRTFAILMN